MSDDNIASAPDTIDSKPADLPPQLMAAGHVANMLRKLWDAKQRRDAVLSVPGAKAVDDAITGTLRDGPVGFDNPTRWGAAPKVGPDGRNLPDPPLDVGTHVARILDFWPFVANRAARWQNPSAVAPRSTDLHPFEGAYHRYFDAP